MRQEILHGAWPLSTLSETMGTVDFRAFFIIASDEIESVADGAHEAPERLLDIVSRWSMERGLELLALPLMFLHVVLAAHMPETVGGKKRQWSLACTFRIDERELF
jgi:hypothetical protein